MAYVEEVMNEYRNSLKDLNFNSKPLINMLTMLAEENEQHAPHIVKVIEDQIIKAKPNRKLPILYLIDSIIKNLPKTSYKSLFSKDLVHTFTTVFEQVDEKTRASMFKLRQTWTSLFPNAKLYGIDMQIKTSLDPAWPITATPPEQTSIHVNPKFLTKSETEQFSEPEPEMSPEITPTETPVEVEENLEEQESLMRQQLIAKQQELLKLQQARLELELAETKEKLQKQKKKNSGKSDSLDQPPSPDTTVPKTNLETVPPPRDPRLAIRDPRVRDPRRTGSPLQPQTSHTSSLIPHSTLPPGLPLPPEIPVPGPESTLVPISPLSGPPLVPPYSGHGAPPPFIQSGQLHVNPGFISGHHPPVPAEGHFKGEVYHPDSSDDGERSDKGTHSHSTSNKSELSHKPPEINRRDPRQAKREVGDRPRTHDNDNSRNNRNNRDIHRKSDHDRNSSWNSNRNSKERDQDPRDSRRSHSPHSSSRSPRSSNSDRDSRSGSNSRDPRLKHHSEEGSRGDTSKTENHGKHDDRISPNIHNSPSKHRNSPSKRDIKRHSRDKSLERSPKHSKKSDTSEDNKEVIDRNEKKINRSQAQKDKSSKGSSKERSISPSKVKVGNKNENAKKSGSVERTDTEGKQIKIKTPKRELETDDSAQEEADRVLSKKIKIEPVDEKPAIVEGADVLGKIQEDIRTPSDSDFSELFGAEDQDYRPADQKVLPLKSPSCKGWDKFKADHPDQYAYDIELKKQRSESMDLDQRPPPEEPQDTDYRVQRQPSWSNDEQRRASTEDVSIPIELSMEHHAEILIQAHKHLQEGKLTHEQHQLLLQQLGELMKIQKLQEETRKLEQLQEQNRRLSLEAERIQSQPSVGEDNTNISPAKPEVPLDRDLRKPSPLPSQDTQKLPPNVDTTPPGIIVTKPPDAVEKISPAKLPPGELSREMFQKEGSPQKSVHKGSPEFERQGPLHNLYPEMPRGPPRGPPLIRPPFPPQPNLHPGHPDFRPPHPGPHVHGIRGPPVNLADAPRPPFDGRHVDDGRPLLDPNHPDFREHQSITGRDQPIAGIDLPPPLDPRGKLDENMGKIPERPRHENLRNPDRHPEYIDRPQHLMGDDMNGPPKSFPEEDRIKPFDGPRSDFGPFDRGDIGRPDMHDFGNRDRSDIGPPGPHSRGPPPVHGMAPDRFDAIPPDSRDFDGRHAPHGRMEMGPPRIDHGPPGTRDIGPDVDLLPDERGHIPRERMEREFPDRRDFGPAERRDWGPPDGLKHGPPGEIAMRPPGLRDHGPLDRFDRGPPGDGRPDKQLMPQNRSDVEHHGRGGNPQDGRDFGPPDRRNMGPSREFDQRDGPHRGRERMDMGHPPWRDQGPGDRDQGPPERRGLNWEGHGPPDRMGMGASDLRPDWHQDGDFRHPDRMGMGHPDRRPPGSPDSLGMSRPDRRDFGPDGFHDTRDFRSHDRIDMGPPDRMGHDRRHHRPPDGMGPLDRRDERPPDRRDWGPSERDHRLPDRMDMEPVEFRGHGAPDRRGHGMIPGSPDKRDHGHPDRMGPPDGRDRAPYWEERPPGWRDHSPPDRRDRPPDRRRDGPLDGRDDRFHNEPGPPGIGEKGPSDRKEPKWPLGGVQRPFNPGIEELGQLVPDRTCPPVNGPREHDKPHPKIVNPSKEIPAQKDKAGPHERDGKTTESDKKANEKAASKKKSEKVAKGRKSPLLPTPQTEMKKKESESKEGDGKEEPKPPADTGKDKKHIPALLELFVKPTPELSRKEREEKEKRKAKEEEEKRKAKEEEEKRKAMEEEKRKAMEEEKRKAREEEKRKAMEEEKRNAKKEAKKEVKEEERKDEKEAEKKDVVDPNTGLGQWKPVEKENESAKSRKKRDKKKKKDEPVVEPRDNDPSARKGEPKHHRGPHGKEDPEWRDGKRPDRRDAPPVGPPDMDQRPTNMRDGPGIGPEGPEGFIRDGPHMMIGPGMEGIRPPGRWEGPPMGPDGPRPPFPPRPPGPGGPMPLGPMVNGPRGPPPMAMGGPEMNAPCMEEDQRWTSFTDMSPEVSEEIVIGNKNYAIKLGDRPRTVKFFNDKIEVYADPSKRGIVVDGNLLYKFGERVKEVEIRGRTTRIFYHGKPVNLWIDGQNYEVRVDAPPRNIEINGNNHKIQIDGRDMMILIDKSEKGPLGGPPRFIFIDEDRMELRFDPPPRHILIDGKLCELMLSMKRPCVNIEGKLHGIRFDGPPREVIINNQVFNIHADKAVKVKVDNRLHYIALGGPCHEIIIDGKWFEMKFGEPPKEINVGNRNLAVHLPGKPPEVKILPEILPNIPGPPGMPIGNRMMGPGPMRPLGPGMEPMMRPPGPGMEPIMRPPGPGLEPMMRPPGPGMEPMLRPGPMMPNQRPMGPLPPNERLPFPIAPRPEMVPLRPEVSQPGVFSMNRPPMLAGQPMMPPFPGPDGPPRPVVSQPPASMGMPIVPTSGMPMFGNVPQPSPAQIPGPAPGPAPPAMDINTLLSKLIATGIIKKDAEPTSAAPASGSTAPAVAAGPTVSGGDKKEESKGVRPIDLLTSRKKVVKQESLEDIPDMTEFDLTEMKELPNGVIQRLYAGIQCTTCGVRFVLDDEEKTEKYREHLDWHFRQNRRERDEMKVARYRQWYYGVNDWIQYEEITDTEETARSMFFECQQVVQPTPAPTTPSNMSFALITVPEGAMVTRCPAATGNDKDDLCAICHEPFEQFWDEELEEWHLRDAIRVNDQTYHPICYEDHTDVSEGTPSPSALPMMPPDFSARKTLSYDESSQDAANTSFEGERQVVKTEPVLDTNVKDNESVTPDIVTISDSPVKPSSHAVVKSEPMDTTDSAIVKEENDPPVASETVTEYTVTSVTEVKEEKDKTVTEDSSNSQEFTPSGTEVVKEEVQSGDIAIEADPVDQEMTQISSQSISETTQNSAAESSVAPVVPASVIATTEGAAGSPAPQETSGGSTPVQDERSRSCTPVKDECPGTPVQDEPMIE